MSDQHPTPNDVLSSRLRHEADADSPVFSHALHHRIMNGIAGAPAAACPTRLRRWIAPAAAIAATVILMVGVVFYTSRARPSHAQQARVTVMPSVPSVPMISNPVRELDRPIVTAWTSDRYDFFHRDGEHLLNYMARQLDVAPQVP